MIGVLVAADFRLAQAVVAALALVLGFTHGWHDGTALAAAGVVTIRQPWTRIAVRVASSWIGASGLLLLGWTLSGRA